MELRDKAIIALKPGNGEDHSDKRGYLVRPATTDSVRLPIAAGDIPFGVILQGEAQGGMDTIALQAYGGTVKIKLANDTGPVSLGMRLVMSNNPVGTVRDPSEGGMYVARALEPGVAGELIEAYLVEPQLIS